MINLIECLSKEKLIPVVKINDISTAIPLAQSLIDGGLNSIEVTFRTPCAKEAIGLIAKTFPQMLIGAGTVITKTQVDEAIEAGASFIVSPGIDKDIIEYCQDKNIDIIPGCVNPTNVQVALSMGLNAVKFFPAEQSGGVETLKALCAPFPHLKIMPTGGINQANLHDYLSLPNIIACGGSFMAPQHFVDDANVEVLTRLSKEAYSTLHKLDEAYTAPEATTTFLTEKLAENKEFDLVTLGEVLLRLSPPINQTTTHAETLTKYAGGAELNVACGVSNLGLNSAVITKIPDNALSDFILSKIKSMGVNCKYIVSDCSKDARLGVYYYENGATPRKPSVVYDRKNSSFTTIDISEIDPKIFAKTKIFHTSGISMAVGEKALKTTIDIIKAFKNTGSIISFDVNFRASLWSEEESFNAISSILPLVDILFISQESMRRMFKKQGELKKMMQSFCNDYDIKLVATTTREVISPKEHNFNAVIYRYEDDRIFTQKPYNAIEIVDRIGSGDAFVGGALCGMLHNDLNLAISYGCALSAYKMSIYGDLPICTKKDIQNVINNHDNTNSSEMNR